MWGRVHLNSVRELGGDRAETRWICTRTRSNLDELQEQYGVERGTTDYHEMLGDPDLDAIIVSTPPFLHAEQGLAVIGAGKHLLLEKPMATTAADAARLVEAAAKHPSQVSMEASSRFSRLGPKFAFVKEIIDSGRIGRVYHIHHRQMNPQTFAEYNPRSSEWANDPERAGGGPVFDWGPYDFAFHLGLIGDPELSRTIHAVGRLDGGIERHAVAMLEFDGGVTYQLERVQGMPCREPSLSRIHGTLGTLVFGYQPWDPEEIELSTFGEDGDLVHETLHCRETRHWHENTYLLDRFVRSIEGKTEPMMPFSLAKRNMEICLEILERIRR